MFSVNGSNLEGIQSGRMVTSSSERCVTRGLCSLVYFQNAHCLPSSELRLAFIPDPYSASLPTLLPIHTREKGRQAGAAWREAAWRGRPISACCGCCVWPGRSQSGAEDWRPASGARCSTHTHTHTPARPRGGGGGLP